MELKQAVVTLTKSCNLSAVWALGLYYNYLLEDIVTHYMSDLFNKAKGHLFNKAKGPDIYSFAEKVNITFWATKFMYIKDFYSCRRLNHHWLHQTRIWNPPSPTTHLVSIASVTSWLFSFTVFQLDSNQWLSLSNYPDFLVGYARTTSTFFVCILWLSLQQLS